MSTIEIAAIVFCIVLGGSALGFLFWLANRPTEQEREQAAAKREELRKLDEAEKKFGNPWGGHG